MNSPPQKEPAAALPGATAAETVATGSLDNAKDTAAPTGDEDLRAVRTLCTAMMHRHGLNLPMAVLATYRAARPRDLHPQFLGNVVRDLRLLNADRTALPASPLLPEVEIGTPILRSVLPPFAQAAAERLRANVPTPLRELATWVCASREPRDIRSAMPKSSKAPLNPRDGSNAKSNDRSTWATFDEAVEHALNNPRCFGVGVNLLGSEFLGLDLDHALDDDGALHPSVADVLLSMPATYCERSPSGTGLRLFYIGAKPPWLQGSAWRNAFGDGLGLEVYDASSKRYLTVTGDVVDVRTLCAAVRS